MKDVIDCEKLRLAVNKHSRRCPNGKTHLRRAGIAKAKRTWGTETSKYPKEKKSIESLLVVASEHE
jgi:hypothetical protein